MKSFRFKLEKVLNVREQESKLAMNALAVARIKSRQADALLETARQRRTESERILCQRRTQRMSVGNWIATSQLHDALVQAERSAAHVVLQSRIEEESRRTELMEAERRKKILDRLKERQYEAYRHAANAAEQAQIDEMAQNIYREGGGRR